MARALKITLHTTDLMEIRRFSLAQASNSWQIVHEQISRMLPDALIFYVDPEGDLVRIASSGEWQECVSTFGGSAVVRLHAASGPEVAAAQRISGALAGATATTAAPVRSCRARAVPTAPQPPAFRTILRAACPPPAPPMSCGPTAAPPPTVPAPAVAPAVVEPLRTVPNVESVYNASYRCQVRGVQLCPRRVGTVVVVEIDVRGDMSLGPLQSAEASTLLVARRGVEAAAVGARRVQLVANEHTHRAGRLFYRVTPPVAPGDELRFRYGTSGYSTVSLLVVPHPAADAVERVTQARARKEEQCGAMRADRQARRAARAEKAESSDGSTSSTSSATTTTTSTSTTSSSEEDCAQKERRCALRARRAEKAAAKAECRAAKAAAKEVRRAERAASKAARRAAKEAKTVARTARREAKAAGKKGKKAEEDKDAVTAAGTVVAAAAPAVVAREEGTVVAIAPPAMPVVVVAAAEAAPPADVVVGTAVAQVGEVVAPVVAEAPGVAADVAMLVAMGFDPAAARGALARAGGMVDRAVELLCA